MSDINIFCLSLYLAFRYVADTTQSWKEGIQPRPAPLFSENQIEVGSAQEIIETLMGIIDEIADADHTGIFMSGGIDSGILASFLPRGTRAYTIDFLAEGFPRESEKAARYAEKAGLELTVVEVTWEDYLQYETELMIHKKAPLHPVEVALYKASLQAKKDGLQRIIIGNGADSTFGGLDKLLSKDWLFDEFIERYTFVKPERVLRHPVSIRSVYEPYRLHSSFIDVVRFLKTVHGLGVAQAFENAIGLAGLEIVQPYERLRLRGDLDLQRIRRGEPKYLLVEVFSRVYPSFTPEKKVAFARPMDVWLRNYTGPLCSYFLPGVSMAEFNGEQRYLIRCLDGFIRILEEGKAWPSVRLELPIMR